jgi:PAS domain S-box-containing protein
VLCGLSADITARRLAEEALRFTRFIVERAGDSVFWMSADGAFRYANPLICETLGHSLDEMCGMTIHDIDPGFPAERWPQHIEELQQAGALTFETRHHAKDGTVIPMEVTAMYLEYDGDKYDVAFARDITERKQAEEALRESEGLYRSLFDNMLNGFAYCEMHFDEQGAPWDFTYLAVNEALASLTGLRDVTGKKVSEVIPGIRETDPELLAAYGRVAVLTMSLVVEARDPYTAGHERRVSELATAIAGEMGMEGEEFAALRLASLIHDIGKIAVPSEILSKPGRLSRIELDLHQAAPGLRVRHPRRHRLRAAGGRDRAAASRTAGRLRLPAGADRRGHPAGSADPGGRRRRRGDVVAPALPPGAGHHGGARRDPRACRHQVRRRGRRDVRAPLRGSGLPVHGVR